MGLHRPTEPGDATRPHLGRQAGGTGGPANAEVTHHHPRPSSTPRSGHDRPRRVKSWLCPRRVLTTSLDTTLDITDPGLWRAGPGIIAVTPARRDLRPPRTVSGKAHLGKLKPGHRGATLDLWGPRKSVQLTFRIRHCPGHRDCSWAELCPPWPPWRCVPQVESIAALYPDTYPILTDRVCKPRPLRPQYRRT